MAKIRHSKKYWIETLQAYLFLLPSLAILGVFVFWPIGFSFVLSFFKWDYTSTEKYFIGLDNYKELFRLSYPVELNFFYALLNSAVYVLAALMVVQLLFYFVKSMTSYQRANARYRGPYIFVAAYTFVYFLTRNLIPEFSVIHVWLGLGYVLMAILAIMKLKDSSHRVSMRSKPWTVVLLFAVFYYILAFVLVPASEDFVRYFTLAKESSDFLKSIYNTVYYVLLSVPTQIFLALGIALLLNMNIRFRTLLRTAYFIPFITSVVAVSLVWQWIFNDQFGLLNYFLSFFGMKKIEWLKLEEWTIPTIAIVSVWQHVGYTAVIFLAGLQSIDKFYYEAAEVDGASPWHKFRYITWPLLSPTTFFVLIITMIGSFKVFSQIFILYQGLPGPVNKSGLTLVYYVFEKFYNEQRMGVASAGAYILFLIILALTMVQFYIGRKRVHYEG